MNVSFTDWSPANATTSWMKDAGRDVVGQKTFTCPESLPNTSGNNGIPNGWTRVNKQA